MNLFIDFLVYTFVYLVPFIFWVIERNKYNSVNFLKYFIIGAVYTLVSIITSGYLMNLIPFIFVIMDIFYIKKDNFHNSTTQTEHNTLLYNDKNDYEVFKFKIKDFKLLKGIKYSFLSYIITAIIGGVWISVFMHFKVTLNNQEIIQIMSKQPLGQFILTIPMVVIFAPIVEEFAFRYILFEKVLSNKINIYFSAILSSIVFAFVHYNLMAFASITIIGLVNCYLIHKKGYWYAVFNHMVFNSISISAILISKLG